MAEQKKAPRKYPVVLVRVAGFPSVDPGRQLLYDVRPSEAKARKMAKRLQETMPEYQWEHGLVTHAEITGIRKAPFANPELGIKIVPPTRVPK